MVLQLNRMISNWERSGQGDGGYTGCEEDDEVGEGVHSHGALDQRKNFVIGTNTYHLYLWEMLEKHDLFGSSIQCLNASVSSGNGNAGVPSLILGKHKYGDDDDSISSSRKSARKSEMETLSASINKHSKSFITAA